MTDNNIAIRVRIFKINIESDISSRYRALGDSIITIPVRSLRQII